MERYLDALARVQRSNRAARLYALVDGGQFMDSFGAAFPAGVGVSLFEGTTDEPLAYAGPWLVDAQEEAAMCDQLVEMEQAAPLCAWLISSVPLRGLAQLLQLRMEAKLPDGQFAMVRLSDPRVVHRLSLMLTAPQLEEFFADIDEWHFHSDGAYNHVGRHHA